MITQSVISDETLELFEDGRSTRDFVFIDDAIAAIKSVILEKERVSTTLNVGTGLPIPLLTLTEKIGSALGKKPRVRMRGRFRIGDVRHAVADTTRLRSRFPHLSFTPIDEGVRRYVEWVKRQPRTWGKGSRVASLSEMQSRGMLLTSASALRLDQQSGGSCGAS
jgi:dTDP-L-rhamnose 4-epimerase